MRARAYRVLCGAMGGVLILAGLAFAVQFFRYHGFAYANPPGTPNPFPFDAYTVYFIALAGCAFLGWGAGLVAAARRPALGRGIGTPTALALTWTVPPSASRTCADTACCSPSSAASTGDPSPRRGSSSCARLSPSCGRWTTCASCT